MGRFVAEGNPYEEPTPEPQGAVPWPPPQQNGVHPPRAAPTAGNVPVQFPPAGPPQPAGTGIPMANNNNGLQPPIAGQNVRPNSEAWKTGLFECMNDPLNAVVTFFFPCLTFGQIAEIIDNGQTSCGTSGLLYELVGIFLAGCSCIYSCTYRTKLRSRFGLVESPGPDWLIHFFCETCALCQEYRELQLRGWDPSIGYLGNMTMRQNQMHQQVNGAMMPPMNQRMMT